MEKHFDSVIFCKLTALAHERNWDAMQEYLDTLSNSRFRTASYILAERILPQVDAETLWECFEQIVAKNTKVYLMTFLKAAVQQYRGHKITFADKRFLAFANNTANKPQSIDRQKCLRTLLPILKTYEEIITLLSYFCADDAKKQLNYLVHTEESIVSYYAIFQLLRQQDIPADELITNLNIILKRSTPTAYNFVSIMREYFGITNQQGNFSLKLKPYQLSRIEQNFDIFSQTLKSMK